MYKVTLLDYKNNSNSGVFSVYCDDIDKFEHEWLQLECDTDIIERFRKSKAGMVVTADYSDDPALNIVQKDDSSEILFEKTIITRKQKLKVHDICDEPQYLYVDVCKYYVRYVKFQGEFLKLVRYKFYGVLTNSNYSFDKISLDQITCLSNPMLRCAVVDCMGRKNKINCKNDTVESIAYYLMEDFNSIEELEKDYMDEREPFFSEEELEFLLRDIQGYVR